MKLHKPLFWYSDCTKIAPNYCSMRLSRFWLGTVKFSIFAIAQQKVANDCRRAICWSHDLQNIKDRQ